MSFAEKIGSLLQRPNEDPVPKDDVPWWMKYAGRGLGTVGGGMAIFLGMWNCIGILLGNIDCLLGGMWQMVAGFLVIVIEAPCCCMFIDFVQTLSDYVDKRPYWNRAVLYGGIAIPAIVFCPGLGSLFGSGLILGTGVIYGMMALGRKGSQQDMAAMASSPTGVVSQADHHTTLMEDPDVWRPT
ncbi:calcium channel flower isoform X1 [Macrosteles quadrilineatus]|uniref:calcium channel flower isoform X1 n=1 Tax=Macrosteles quadrilineatus TaxID=74068 RepID=UPI0023E0F8DB|nr:calcium channel flower isoform X1 [Macrosteles quadrilineatus]XP_054282662.1 calcium channel flower isoform X1 [Macrosteles quadrilineatus]